MSESLLEVYKLIDELDDQSKSLIATFEKRISFLYDHKTHIRFLESSFVQLKKYLSAANEKDRAHKNELIAKIGDILTRLYADLQTAFYSVLPDDLKNIQQIEINKFNENIRSIIADCEYLEQSTHEHATKALESMRDAFRKALDLERDSLEIKKKFLERLERFKQISNELQDIVLSEQSLIRVAKEELIKDRLTAQRIDYFIFEFKKREEKLEKYLLAEKEVLHNPWIKMFDSEKRSQRLARNIMLKGVESITLEDIKRDVASFNLNSSNDILELTNYRLRVYRFLADPFDINTPFIKKAAHYLKKILSPKKDKRLVYLEGVESLIANRQNKKNAYLESQSYNDKLTGLFNRKFLYDKLLASPDNVFSVILFDIDFFKNFNTVYGHQGGDLVLVKVADWVNAEKRSGDFAMRWGGEEFLLFLPRTNKNDAKKVAERLRLRVEKESEEFMESVICKRCTLSEGLTPIKNITITLGVASYPEEKAFLNFESEEPFDNYEGIVELADQRLMNSKNNNRRNSVAE